MSASPRSDLPSPRCSSALGVASTSFGFGHPRGMPDVVLDTNVVLDWLVFRDPGCDALAHGLLRMQLRWLATEAMRKELEHVLTRGTLDAWEPDRTAVLASWDRWATHVEPLVSAPPAAMRCTDPDDQKFIDLALQVGAAALLSRDRAVLALAPRARVVGLDILSAADWARRTRP